MIVKLLTGSRLLLDDSESSSDVDYIVIIDSKKYPDTLQYNNRNEIEDLFIFDISKSYNELLTHEKERLFYLIITLLLHKKLDMKLEDEYFYEDYIEKCSIYLKDILDNNIIGIKGRIKRVKWAWWIWIAIKVIKDEWKQTTIEQIKSVFRNSRANILTASEKNYIEDYIVEEVLFKSNILSETIKVIRGQAEMIEQYNSRHIK